MPDSPMQINGYTIYEHECFTRQLDRLATTIESQKRSEKSSRSEEAKLLERILGEIENIALNPDSPEYRLGKTLGPEYKFWRRAKFMGRYRLFFRYDSNSKIIILAWVNDSGTK
ncbi:TPA: type II toxin-antitoxin system YhaV family toxin, partial [Neisseria gonorrhoeae]